MPRAGISCNCEMMCVVPTMRLDEDIQEKDARRSGSWIGYVTSGPKTRHRFLHSMHGFPGIDILYRRQL